MAANVFPRDGEGFRAEIKIGDDIHLVLSATHSALGPAATVYDAKRKKWFAERDWAEDIEDAKKKAEFRARKWYAAVGRKEALPAIEWQATG
jgi:hypothetical protein